MYKRIENKIVSLFFVKVNRRFRFSGIKFGPKFHYHLHPAKPVLSGEQNLPLSKIMKQSI